MKKASGDVTILNLSNKKYDYMMYVYSDMECDRHNLLSFQVIFLCFVPLLTPKIKVWKNVKKTPGDITFYTCAPLIKIISCMFLKY